MEDLIQESIARGEFDNLPGSGKPLKFSPENPYVDSTTHKLNQVLIANGYVPEWITLEREIREAKEALRNELRKCRAQLGVLPLCDEERRVWDNAVSQLSSSATQVNRKIDKFNMVVPLPSKQQWHFQLPQESEKILKSASARPPGAQRVGTIHHKAKEEEGFLSFLLRVIKST